MPKILPLCKVHSFFKEAITILMACSAQIVFNRKLTNSAARISLIPCQFLILFITIDTVQIGQRVTASLRVYTQSRSKKNKALCMLTGAMVCEHVSDPGLDIRADGAPFFAGGT